MRKETASSLPIQLLLPGYVAYISQIIRYAQACILCSDILKRHYILSTKQLSERFINSRLILYSEY
jgi:hypothetical protein